MDSCTQERFNELQFSLDQELKSRGNLDMTAVRLMCIRERIDSQWMEDGADLRECRAAVCEICREARLYVCDAEEGWSVNCALIQHHTNRQGQ